MDSGVESGHNIHGEVLVQLKFDNCVTFEQNDALRYIYQLIFIYLKHMLTHRRHETV